MKKLANFFLIVGILACMAMAVQAESYEVVRWLDGFESHTCGDYLISYTGHPVYPDIPGSVKSTNLWNTVGLDDILTTIDCARAFEGSQSVEQAYGGSGTNTSMIVAYPQYYYRVYSNGPHIMVRPGVTTVVEMEANFNWDLGTPINVKNNGEGQAALVWHSSTLPVAGWYSWGYGGVRYLNGTGYSNYVDGGVVAPSVVPNVWNHFRMEVYEDFTFSVFVTLNGESTPQTVVSKAPCQNIPSNNYYYRDFLELRLVLAKGIINWDNVKISYIANNAQGFRDIYNIPAGIAIDGSLGANEWSKATKVASKPLNGDGVFKSQSHRWLMVLNPNEFIDVYSAYDSNNFYVAGRFNQIDINDISYEGSFFEAVFTFDPDVSYVFACSAEATSGTTGLLTKFVGKESALISTNWDPCEPSVLDYNDFTNAGGLIAYSVTGGVMNVEMKIPFSYMPQFTGIVPGKKVNLQFNVSGSATGTDTPESLIAYTTNIGFEQYPWQLSIAEIGTPFGAGVAFPVCGSADNQPPVGDLNNDCIVNIEDLEMLVANWLVAI